MTPSAPWWAIPVGVVLGALVTGAMSVLTARITAKANRASALTARLAGYDDRLWEHRIPLYLELANICNAVERQVSAIYDNDADQVPLEQLTELSRLADGVDGVSDRVSLFAEEKVLEKYFDLEFNTRIFRDDLEEAVEDGRTVVFFGDVFEWAIDEVTISDISVAQSMLRYALSQAIQGPEYDPSRDTRSRGGLVLAHIWGYASLALQPWTWRREIRARREFG